MMSKANKSDAEAVVTSKNVKKKMVEYYIESLSQNKIPWNQGWQAERHFNAVMQRNYHGTNYLLLQYVSMIKGYTDPRWCTVKQANSQGWKIKPTPKDVKGKGEIYGVPIQYWMPYEKDENGKVKKWLSWDAYNAIKADQENTIPVDVKSRTFYVFNAQEIEGIPPYEGPKHSPKIEPSPFIDHLIEQMHVKYLESGDKAYYKPDEDIVVIPPKDSFFSEYDYHSTRLHELCHATGHSNRLGREISNEFGSKDYAREELNAEIASSFLSLDIGLPVSEEHIKNHAAYIQSWIEILEKEPQELFQAIKSADDIEKYALEMGEWEKFKEIAKSEELEIDETIPFTESPFDKLVARIDRFMEDVDWYEYQDQNGMPVSNLEIVVEDLQDGGHAIQEYIQELSEEDALTPEQEQEAEMILLDLDRLQKEKALEKE